jgi:hypothetical protein
VHRPGPAKRDEDELSRIKTPVNRDQLDLVGHVFIGRFDDGVGGGFYFCASARTKRAADLL